MTWFGLLTVHRLLFIHGHVTSLWQILWAGVTFRGRHQVERRPCARFFVFSILPYISLSSFAPHSSIPLLLPLFLWFPSCPFSISPPPFFLLPFRISLSPCPSQLLLRLLSSPFLAPPSPCVSPPLPLPRLPFPFPAPSLSLLPRRMSRAALGCVAAEPDSRRIRVFARVLRGREREGKGRANGRLCTQQKVARAGPCVVMRCGQMMEQSEMRWR